MDKNLFRSVVAGLNGGAGLFQMYMGNYGWAFFSIAVAAFLLFTIDTTEEEE